MWRRLWGRGAAANWGRRQCRSCYCMLQMPESELLKLEAVTRRLGVHLLVARSYGLMGALRVGARPASPRHPPQVPPRDAGWHRTYALHVYSSPCISMIKTQKSC